MSEGLAGRHGWDKVTGMQHSELGNLVVYYTDPDYVRPTSTGHAETMIGSRIEKSGHKSLSNIGVPFWSEAISFVRPTADTTKRDII